MNADRLLALYERVTNAPDAIARLRRFVLDLAVRGKLVEQDPADEPAAELLNRIAAEKTEGAKRNRSLPDVQADELGGIPRNWCAVPLIALGQWAIGSGFPKSEQGRTEGPYFFLKVSDMNLPENYKYIMTANNRIDEAAAERMKARIHPPGTIIFPKIGGAIATNKRRILERNSAIDNNCLGITISSHIDLEWAYLLLTSLDFAHYQAGTAVPALQQGSLGAIPVALPPLAEQRRIVAKVDELMALCGRLEEARTAREDTRDRLTTASLARLSAPDTDAVTFHSHARFAVNSLSALTARADQVKHFRQTILTLAVRGKLVEQNPADEPASGLLKRIAAEKSRLVSAKKIKRSEVVPILPEEYPFEIPHNWVWTRLGTIGDWGAGSTPPRGNADLYGGGVTWLKSGELNDNIALAGSKEKVTEIAVQKGSFRTNQPGDVLIAMYGATIGKLAILAEVAVTNQAVCGCTPLAGVSNHYLFLFLLFQRQQFQRSSEGGAQPNISKIKIVSTPFPLPPLAEQHRIVAKIDELMTLYDRLERSVAASGATRSRLLEALLHEALDPTDSRVTGDAASPL